MRTQPRGREHRPTRKLGRRRTASHVHGGGCRELDVAQRGWTQSWGEQEGGESGHSVTANSMRAEQPSWCWSRKVKIRPACLGLTSGKNWWEKQQAERQQGRWDTTPRAVRMSGRGSRTVGNQRHQRGRTDWIWWLRNQRGKGRENIGWYQGRLEKGTEVCRMAGKRTQAQIWIRWVWTTVPIGYPN